METPSVDFKNKCIYLCLNQNSPFSVYEGKLRDVTEDTRGLSPDKYYSQMTGNFMIVFFAVVSQKDDCLIVVSNDDSISSWLKTNKKMVFVSDLSILKSEREKILTKSSVLVNKASECVSYLMAKEDIRSKRMLARVNCFVEALTSGAPFYNNDDLSLCCSGLRSLIIECRRMMRKESENG